MATNAQQIISNTDNSPTNQFRRIATFSGTDKKVQVESWIALFELVSDGKTDRERLILLMQYLTEEAINWIANDVCPLIDTIKWTEVKALMVQRFGTPVVHPIIEAQKRILTRTDTIQSYFDDKMNILRRANLPESAMVALLTDGMPQNYRPTLIGSQPQTPLTWLAISSQLESSYNKASLDRNTRQSTSVHFTEQQSKFNQKPQQRKEIKKPPAPCHFCAEVGENNWHWHRDCNRRNQRQTQRDETITNIDATASSMAVEPDTPPTSSHLNWLGGRC